jgi:hypothetical protein
MEKGKASGRREWKKPGDKVVARDRKSGKVLWEFTIKKVVRLAEPERFKSRRGSEEFDPHLIFGEHKDGKKELWFPYWIAINGRWRYGQFAPLFSEDIFFELLEQAIAKDFFSRRFLRKLSHELEVALSK